MATTIQKHDQCPHSATFPKKLPAMCIRLHGVHANLVMLDPFLGIGNSAVAVLECGIERFIGFEIDREYLKRAKQLVGETLDAQTGSSRQI